MEDISKLKLKICEIGQQMVNCSNKCKGIAYSLEEGVLPRCLILETNGRSANKGSLIIGINPGHSKPPEHNYYIRNGCTYDAVIEYWNSHIGQVKYYKKLRHFVDQLELKGPILWTELVKCENETRGKIPPLQTFRVCTKTYLNKEINLMPEDWPFIAVGGEAYKALAYRFPSRIVIGIPHPTGSFGHFSKLSDESDVLSATFKFPLYKLWDGKNGKAVWFDAKNKQIR